LFSFGGNLRDEMGKFSVWRKYGGQNAVQSFLGNCKPTKYNSKWDNFGDKIETKYLRKGQGNP
jgi:hypothetical protein